MAGRGYRYIEDEQRIQTNRVKEAVQAIKEHHKVTSILQVAVLLGQNWRAIYRLQQHKVLPLNLSYAQLQRWSDLSRRPIQYLTGEWL